MLVTNSVVAEARGTGFGYDSAVKRQSQLSWDWQWGGRSRVTIEVQPEQDVIVLDHVAKRFGDFANRA